MAKMLRTMGGKNVQKDKTNDKISDSLLDKLPDHVSRMWELPQIYEFLCFAKDTLHIESLSMYEMERMLSMPRASKQLANIMTSLLSSSMPRSRLLKIPSMPYEFWTNVLLNHKVNTWLKVYESKEHDSIKVLDAIGVEPEFWTIFPDVSTMRHCNFEELNLRQRVWLLKTVCDTMMHGKKSLQDEVANRYLDGEGEKILGRDRYGARYVYFPIFLDNDIRVYKHNLNNKILLNVTPIAPKLKIHTRRIYNQRDRRRKKSRWKNGNLPQRQKRRTIKTIKVSNVNLKCSIKNESTDDETRHSDSASVDSKMSADLYRNVEKEKGRSQKGHEVGQVNEERDDMKEKEKEDDTDKEEKEMEDEEEEGEEEEEEEEEDEEEEDEEEDDEEGEEEEEEDEDNKPEEPGKREDMEVLNSSLTSKSSEVDKNDGQPHPDNVSNSSKTDDEKINEIKTITSIGSAVCSSKMNNGEISKSDDEKLIETKTIIDNNGEDDKVINNNERLSDQVGLNTWMKALLENNDCKNDIKDCHDENSHDSFMGSSDCIRTRSKTATKREMKKFNNILMDLGVSTFQLVADSVESLRELIVTLSTQNSIATNEPVRCEMLLIKKMKALSVSLKPKESLLKESTENARKKLVREWKHFQDGINEDDVSNGARHSSEWVLGSQGCPLLSCSDTLQHDENENDHMKSEREDDDDEEEDDRIKEKTETRRVLRARGVSSYMEQFSSDDDTDSSHPEGWAEIVDPATGIHLGMSAVQADGVVDEDEESEGSGSDQDWILPGKRKRKSKRIPAGRRLKSFQNKFQAVDVDVKNTEPTSSLDNKQRKICPKDTLSTIKIESVHSEFHIKDEVPVTEPQPANNNVVISDSNVQQNYVLHHVVNTPSGQVNYVVMPNDNPPMAESSQVVSMVPQVPMQSGYYMHNPQGFLVSNPQITPVRSPFVDQQTLQPVHGVLVHPNNQPYVTPAGNYIQYQRLVVPPVSLYPPTVQPPIVNPPVRFPTQSTKMQPRIVQNRQIVPPYRPRHPVGAVIRSTMPFRADTRAVSGRGRGNRALPPRNPTAVRNIRPAKTNTGKGSSKNDATKTTSLIVLSDSDDEIEMIIPQKNEVKEQKQSSNKETSSLQNKIVDDSQSPVASTTGDGNSASSQGILTSQIIQRMSQGGISITPIKPKAPAKSTAISPTQLVVVVNETGNHYALALPNGSKLILTPEQVAQIRASNGGKLVL